MPANVYNANWLAANLTRKYPLDSMSSCIDSNGNKLPDDLIVDIQISYPEELGDYCYIASANITKDLISILIAADGVPIAALCTRNVQSDDRSIYKELIPLHDGVAGVIALGVDVNYKEGSYSFGDDVSARILPSCCTPYKHPNVISVGRPGDSEPLTGDVLLTAGNDIKLDIVNVDIDGNESKVILVGLDLTVDARKTLLKYINNCSRFTEMGTCGRVHVESIGSAVPKCDGNITIEGGPTNTVHVDTLESGVVLLSTDTPLEKVCRDDSPFGEGGNGVGTPGCPYPGPNSDDICKVNVSLPVEYPNEGTDLNLYESVNLDDALDNGGILYGASPTNDKSIRPADEGYSTTVYFTIKPAEYEAVMISFGSFNEMHNPNGSVHLNIGNDMCLIDYGQVSTICDEGLIESNDRTYHGNHLLTGCTWAVVTFTDTELTLLCSNGLYRLADLDDGLTGFGDRGLTITMSGDVTIEGVRYV